jgi:hypothetical protein
MADRIRVIPHYPEGIPDCGSFEVWFADGRPSQYFHWDDNPGRASITRNESGPGKEAARALARIERVGAPSDRRQGPARSMVRTTGLARYPYNGCFMKN